MALPLKFQPFSSKAEVSFWRELARLKLEVYRLSDDVQPLLGSYSPSRSEHIPSRLCVRGESFDLSVGLQHGEWPARGELYNTNTLENFKVLNKGALINDCASKIWLAIRDGSAVRDPSLLVRFVVLSFADLKSHKFVSWFAFPALPCATPIRILNPARPLTAIMAPSELANFGEALELANVAILPARVKSATATGFFLCIRSDCEDLAPPRVLPLSKWVELSQVERGRAMLGFVDPCAISQHPGWPLRNFLALAAARWRLKRATVLCLRSTAARGCPPSGIVLDVELTPDEWDLNSSSPPRDSVGWEPNRKGRMGPRMSDLGAQLDPARLAETACSLNLKLMRWRALPQLDTKRLAETRCLLLGAGTLGCAVARTLLGWGFRHLTFVDNGRVSYSNPVRQSLYCVRDCAEGGRYKAQAAAEALCDIFPAVQAEGITLSIPMPGHAVGESEHTQLKADLERLDGLVRSHDVVILLTDTRESRWLPTVLGAAHGKLVLNAALGFDSYLVMRHGSLESGNNRPGCYFCNDVVAPQNSTRDRTLDQQCTVTRPGLAPIAGALLVELLVALLHHPKRECAPVSDGNEVDGSCSGDSGSKPTRASSIPEGLCPGMKVLPHQIRGFVSNFSNVLLSGPSFEQCTACSCLVVQAYRDRGFELLLTAMNNPAELEELTGLAELQRKANEVVSEMCWDEQGDDDDW